MNPDEVIPRTFKYFSGGCHAVVLNTRDESDPHICMSLITEDDTNWFISKKGQFSSAWGANVLGLFSEAMQWMVQNADPEMVDGRQYGWRKR